MAAFSVFFTQCPSFLSHQQEMKKKKGKDNAESLFGLKERLCDNQIRTLLDPVPAQTIFNTFKTAQKWLEKNEIINQFKYLDNQILVALDGTEYYSSKKINCPNCNCRNHKNGSTTYYHQVITPVEEKMLTMIKGGRTRWKIENENNNILKNQGYNFEHNFGHGKENLSEILLSLNLLSFLDHNILEIVNVDYQKVREKIVKRKTFFDDLRALLKYIWFISWEDLLFFMLTEVNERKLINSS